MLKRARITEYKYTSLPFHLIKPKILGVIFNYMMEYSMKATILSILLLFASQVFAANPQVLIETNKGNIKLELFEDKAPISTKNFLKYVDDGFYNGLIFHRVIGNFMIQGGGFDKNMNRKETNAPIKNEARNGISNARGTIAMARTNIVDSATSQFFINVVNNKFLDHSGTDARSYGYAVFGKVIEGLDIVDKIKVVQTGVKNGMRDVPLEPVVMNKVTRFKPKSESKK